MEEKEKSNYSKADLEKVFSVLKMRIENSCNSIRDKYIAEEDFENAAIIRDLRRDLNGSLYSAFTEIGFDILPF